MGNDGPRVLRGGLYSLSAEIKAVVSFGLISSLHFKSCPGAAFLIGDHAEIERVGPAVPEPSTWAMLILGFFGIGFVAKINPSAVGLGASDMVQPRKTRGSLRGVSIYRIDRKSRRLER
jgi:hypothetical protein